MVKDADLIIANPLRLLEIIEENEGLVNLNCISFLIVDEYIQFRKLQLMDHVKKLVEKLPVNIYSNLPNIFFKVYISKLKLERQTAVFSRLVPSGIQRQGDEFVTNCIFVEMHHDKESANDEIKQVVELCDKSLKACR